MKLSKTSWLLLTFGIFIVLFASLGMAYSEQGKEQSQLNQELSQAQLLLNKLAQFSPEKFSYQQKELENRLAQAKSELETAKTNLSQLIESIEVTNTFFEVAQTCDVVIIEIRSAGMTSKKLEGIKCPVRSVRAKVEGDVPKLINFILQISRKFPTGVVESVKIEVPKVTGEEAKKPSANLVLSIHTYGGD